MGKHDKILSLSKKNIFLDNLFSRRFIYKLAFTTILWSYL